MASANWLKCTGDKWCSLINLNLNDEHFNGLEGVYIIWHGGPSAATIRVGQGNIRARLSSHRTDPQILSYKSWGLYVTWASVNYPLRNGIERYLFDVLKPKIGSRAPDVNAIDVNLPW